jgi:hypothetical protein
MGTDKTTFAVVLDKINPRIVFPSFAQTFLGPSKNEKKGKKKKKIFFFFKVRAKKSAKPDKEVETCSPL